MLGLLLSSAAVGALSGCVGVREQGGQLNAYAPRQPLNPDPVAYRQTVPGAIDRIQVVKHTRRMYLYQNGRVVREMKVSLGRNPVGPKMEQGDNRTPEGVYYIDWRNPDSNYHLSLRISYPNEDDLNRARERGVNPGSMIMIHGLPNGKGDMVNTHRLTDWTNGCIAVTNQEMDELWRVVPTGTPIEIKA
jgi:murein L,D-transpeptidase YafK